MKTSKVKLKLHQVELPKVQNPQQAIVSNGTNEEMLGHNTSTKGLNSYCA
jgi:hypothetical protein